MLSGHYHKLKLILIMVIIYGEGYPRRRLYGKRHYLLKKELTHELMLSPILRTNYMANG